MRKNLFLGVFLIAAVALCVFSAITFTQKHSVFGSTPELPAPSSSVQSPPKLAELAENNGQALSTSDLPLVPPTSVIEVQRDRPYRGRLFEGFPDARTFLQQYWGEQWPEIEKEFAGWGLEDKLQKWDIRSIADWQDARLEILAQVLATLEKRREDSFSSVLKWGQTPEATETYLRLLSDTDRTFTDASKQEIIKAVTLENGELREIEREYHAQRCKSFEHAILYGEDRCITKHPILMPKSASVSAATKNTIEIKTVVAHGWAVSCVLTSDDYPLLADASKRLHEAAEFRLVKIKALASHLP
jgi:hypothetical protein